MLQHGVSPWLAIPAGFAIGVGIGLLTGWLVARIGIPSFVVTLSFFLGVAGRGAADHRQEGGTIPIRNTLIIALVEPQHAPGARLGPVGARRRRLRGAGYLRAPRPRAAGLAGEPLGSDRDQGRASSPSLLGRRHLHAERATARSPGAVKKLEGVPIVRAARARHRRRAARLLHRDAWGRHVYAVGGNIEAARRAGINVGWSRSLLHHARRRGLPRGHVARLAAQLGLPADGRQRHPAARGRRGRDRRRQPVRRPGQADLPGRRRPGGRDRSTTASA